MTRIGAACLIAGGFACFALVVWAVTLPPSYQTDEAPQARYAVTLYSNGVAVRQWLTEHRPNGLDKIGNSGGFAYFADMQGREYWVSGSVVVERAHGKHLE